ncbi:hypothetical protein [Actinocorallia aurantiaca]|uniref:ASCH domain-containing protein n=1 Tax=Actinocorallia aurantiaca TaxID=46204 RepID=A0ABN3UDZ9_9ACTN
MKKVPTLFVRDWDGDPRYVTRRPNPECAWVFAGEGTATRKYDGTCVMYDGERWWARREVKKDKAPPAGFVEIQRDGETGKTMGWEPVEQSAFARFHAEALADAAADDVTAVWPRGTYELLGPKINRNPEGYERHALVMHAAAEDFEDLPRDYDGLAAWLHSHPYEGVVWHHEDGRMAKLKVRDIPKEAAG